MSNNTTTQHTVTEVLNAGQSLHFRNEMQLKCAVFGCDSVHSSK